MCILYQTSLIRKGSNRSRLEQNFRHRNAGEKNLIIRKGQIITAQLNNSSAGMETDHSSPTDAPNNKR